MQAKLYITDEGYGPLVRQSAILTELFRLLPELSVTLQTEKHLQEAKRLIPGLRYSEVFNNICWHKSEDGTPDAHAIRAYYHEYPERSMGFIQRELKNQQPDFILSDFVYEAFEIGSKSKTPAFGVAHFTWDWFFSKFYPPVVRQDLLLSWMQMAETARALFFPPFTPQEILNQFGKNAVQVPFIVRKHDKKTRTTNPKKCVMLIDSGSGVNSQSIRIMAEKLAFLKEYDFYLPKSPGIESDNIYVFEEGTLLLDKIGDMDLVVGRAGFNTISECVACRTPMLLFGEALNPEMQENIVFIKQMGLGSFTSIDNLRSNPEKVLSEFFEGEYDIVNRNMQTHDYAINGAEVVAANIADMMGSKFARPI